MTPRLQQLFQVTAGRARFQPLYRRLHRLALRGLNYGNEDASRNGEEHLLDVARRILPGQTITAIDVGAFHGDWTRAVLARFPQARVLAFEPIPSSYEQLEKTLAGRAELRQAAVGDTTGTAPMYAPGDADVLASLHERDLSDFELTTEAVAEVPVVRLDDVLDEEAIASVQLLKIDTEGHELAVMRGAAQTLAAGTIELIQFEFGGASIDSKVFLREIIAAIGSGYTVFRLLRDGFAPVSGGEFEEVFVYSNFVAVRSDLAARLTGS